MKPILGHKTISKNNGSIHYFISGNPIGETIVFLHPAFGDHRCFDHQIDYFSSDFKVITIDMPGHGLSASNQSKEKITSMPQIITEILQAEDIEKTHVVGVSLGSLLAQDFALKYPEKTLSVTVLGGYDINKKQKEVAKAQRNEMFKVIPKIVFSMNDFRRYVASVGVIDETEQMRYFESAKKFTRKSFAAMSGTEKLIADRPDFKRIYPFLLLVGDKDTELALKGTRQWHKDDPSSELIIIENAGHCANMDNAEMFNEVLMKFLTTKE